MSRSSSGAIRLPAKDDSTIPQSTDPSPSARLDRMTSPSVVRKLVLNYLLHHCYLETAQALARDEVLIDSDPSMSASEAHDDVSSTAGPSGSSTWSNPASTIDKALTPLRGSNTRSTATPHPLSAPPLSRQDSQMEVEGDPDLQSDLLAVASGRRQGEQRALPREEDAEMGDAQEADMTIEGDDTVQTEELKDAIGSELSAEDLAFARLRLDIRNQIVAGRIRQAIDLLNANFPTVLNDDAESSGSSSPRKPSTKPSSSRSQLSQLPETRFSLAPQHLSLNLQIQAFIEAVRAASQPQAASSSIADNGSGGRELGHQSSSPTPYSNGHGSIAAGLAASISRSSSPAPSSVSDASSTGSHPSGPMSGALIHAITLGQALYATINRMKDGPYKDLYSRETGSITAILAYKELDKSPLKKYLDVKRREGLAEQINNAILYRTGRPSQPLIESAVRQATFTWSTLHDENINVPSDHPCFTARGSGSGGPAGTGRMGGEGETWGYALNGGRVTVTAGGTSTTTTTNVGDKKGKGKVPAKFDFGRFLAER